MNNRDWYRRYREMMVSGILESREGCDRETLELMTIPELEEMYDGLKDRQAKGDTES